MVNMAMGVKPIFVHGNENQIAFAGTGFFVNFGNRHLLVTANHVLDGRAVSILNIPAEPTGFQISEVLVATKLLAVDKLHDLAVMEPDFEPDHAFELATNPPPGNLRIGSLEYARFSIDSAKRQIYANPSSRVGNLVREAYDTVYPFRVLELSYPALRGASGAPVINVEGNEAFQVIGIIVANAQYELMPIQKYQYESADGKKEETHYYLPAALAMPVEHLARLLETI
jgi:S1-C subfamily serine protease